MRRRAAMLDLGRHAGRRPPGGRRALALASRKPPHPGEFLETRFLKPLGITQTELAAALGVSRRRVNELINGRRAITPDTAVRLACISATTPRSGCTCRWRGTCMPRCATSLRASRASAVREACKSYPRFLGP